MGQYLLQYQLHFYWHSLYFYEWKSFILLTVFYYSQSCKVVQRQPKSDIIQKWALDRTPVTIFVHFTNFPGEIKMKQIKGIHLLSHKKIPKNCQIMHLLTFMARIYSRGHTYLQERLGTVAFIKFSCMEERDHRYRGDLAASVQPWSMVIAALFLIADSWRQLKIYQIICGMSIQWNM